MDKPEKRRSLGGLGVGRSQQFATPQPPLFYNIGVVVSAPASTENTLNLQLFTLTLWKSALVLGLLLAASGHSLATPGHFWPFPGLFWLLASALDEPPELL